MSKKIREKSRICAMCDSIGRTEEHHLIYGRFGNLRNLADQDGLIIDLCPRCHESSQNSKAIERIHDNVAAERLSKMLGQMMYERNKLAEMLGDEEAQKDKVRASFMQRYGRSFL